MSPRYPASLSPRSSFREYRIQPTLTSTHPEIAFWKYVLGIQSREMRLDHREERTLSRASDGAGGFLVPADFDALVTTLRRSGSIIGRLAREIVTADGRVLRLALASVHGVSVWTAENAGYTASDETFAQRSLNAFKGATAVIVSEELFEDALPAFDEFLAAELAGRQVTLEEAAFAVGDGAGKPLGIAHSTSGYPVVTAATGSSTSFKFADVLAAYAALPAGYLPRASWLMSPSAFRSLAGALDSSNGLVLPTLHQTEPSLMGLPVAVSPDMPAAAANARSVVFGDISAAYTVRRVSGLGVKRQDQLYASNGQIGYVGSWRVDGRPVDLDAAIVLRNSAT